MPQSNATLGIYWYHRLNERELGPCPGLWEKHFLPHVVVEIQTMDDKNENYGRPPLNHFVTTNNGDKSCF